MSKTDRTRPGWVTSFFTGTLEHDHTHGECRIETLDEARRRRGATCRHRLQLGYVHESKMHGDRMTPGFEHLIYHHPMRRSARDVLHQARGEYNAGHRPGDDDLEDRWEPPRLAANNAIWLFW